MNNLKLIMVLIAIPLFITSAVAHIYIKLNLKPKDDPNDFSWEFQDQNPASANYNKYSQAAFTGVIISMLLLFIALIF